MKVHFAPRSWNYLLGPLAAALVLAAGASSWALQRSDPVPFRPAAGGKGQGSSLPRGEVLVYQFLQKLADSTGEPVYLDDNAAPDAKIVLPRALSSLDLKTAREILEKEELELSQEVYRGKEVYWVRRLIVPPNRKGKIVRSGQKSEQEEETPKDSRRLENEPADSRQASKLHSYRREEGAGARFLLLFETDSQSEAEEVQSLIKAHQRSKAAKR